MFNFLIRRIKRKKNEKKWRKLNTKNYTIYDEPSNFSRISVGDKTYGKLNVFISGNEGFLKIGSYCSIANNVFFVLCGEHNLNTLSTYPFKTMCIGSGFEAKSKGDIVVGDDVWIGLNSTILSGVSIGQGAIVASCSVVTKDVPPYAVVAGNPARIIKYRFSNKIINKLLTIDFSKITISDISRNIELLYTDINDENVDFIINKFFDQEKNNSR